MKSKPEANYKICFQHFDAHYDLVIAGLSEVLANRDYVSFVTDFELTEPNLTNLSEFLTDFTQRNVEVELKESQEDDNYLYFAQFKE